MCQQSGRELEESGKATSTGDLRDKDGILMQVKMMEKGVCWQDKIRGRASPSVQQEIRDASS